jgi:hypothetical protein
MAIYTGNQHIFGSGTTIAFAPYIFIRSGYVKASDG